MIALTLSLTTRPTREYVEGQSYSYVHVIEIFTIFSVGCQRSKGRIYLFGASTLSEALLRLKRALERVDAGPNGKNAVYWTSLREVRSATSI